jgi:hypothetical protein
LRILLTTKFPKFSKTWTYPKKFSLVPDLQIPYNYIFNSAETIWKDIWWLTKS